MKLVLTGSTGFLGSHFLRQASQKNIYEILSLTRRPHQLFSSAPGVKELICDLNEPSEWKKEVQAFAPDCILHLAAMASPTACAGDRERAFSSNVELTKLFRDTAADQGCRLIMISSDWVFDGRNAPEGGFLESDSPEPASVYGDSKYQAELLCKELAEKVAILRCSLIFGAELAGRRSALSWLEDGLKGLMSINLLEDEWRTPIFVEDVIKTLNLIIQQEESGIFHCAGPERISRADFGQQYAECFGVSSSLIKRVRREEVEGLEYRPEDLSLSAKATCEELGTSFCSPARAFEILKMGANNS